MAEPRKNHLTIDGGQVKDDDHVVASYKQIPELDTAEQRASKHSLTKSKERVSDEAEEKLLQKEDEAKITTRVDMADAKYVVGDHRNGDAKIELDANKRQFSGLTKEELLKYADDPFWVRLRWLMFGLFWALWLCMLAGAIAIIVRAPKCVAPAAKTWYEVGPLADLSDLDYGALEAELATLEQAKVEGIFITPCENTYDVLQETAPACFDQFKTFVKQAKEKSIKVIVDLTANFVSTTHPWFQQSENGSEIYGAYFTWANSKDYNPETNKPEKPNRWVSTLNEPAWSWSEKRQSHYLHQFGANQPDLNFNTTAVVEQFDKVLAKWMGAGAAGVRLVHARHLLVDQSLKEEEPASGAAPVGEYRSTLHHRTADVDGLEDLLSHWAHLVGANATEPTVFTLKEDGLLQVEWVRGENTTFLRPPSAAPLRVSTDVTAAVEDLKAKLKHWVAIKLTSPLLDSEVSTLAMLLPAAPVLGAAQLPREGNYTAASDSFARLSELRSDASVQHGRFELAAVPARNQTQPSMIACTRWKAGHTGFVVVYNPGEAARANLTRLPLPDKLAIHHISHQVREEANYTKNVDADDVMVPANSAVVLSYVPPTTVEQ